MRDKPSAEWVFSEPDVSACCPLQLPFCVLLSGTGSRPACSTRRTPFWASMMKLWNVIHYPDGNNFRSNHVPDTAGDTQRRYYDTEFPCES